MRCRYCCCYWFINTQFSVISVQDEVCVIQHRAISKINTTERCTVIWYSVEALPKIPPIQHFSDFFLYVFNIEQRAARLLCSQWIRVHACFWYTNLLLMIGTLFSVLRLWLLLYFFSSFFWHWNEPALKSFCEQSLFLLISHQNPIYF